MKALVSIIMPVFNAERYVAEAITSVIGQSYTHWELLIVNDGSTDASRERILEAKDSRIRYFEQPNKGTSAARNVGLAYVVSAKGICMNPPVRSLVVCKQHQNRNFGHPRLG